jgi:hypothetical protein
MSRCIIVFAFVLLGCAGPVSLRAPTPAELAADTARATLVAALLDEPMEPFQVLKPVLPRPQGRSDRNSAVVLAFTIDSMGRIDPATMSVVEMWGDLSFARAACAEVPRTQIAPLGKPGPILAFVPFIHFRNEMPPEFAGIYKTARARLEKMTTVERRDFLLDKGCRRYR